MASEEGFNTGAYRNDPWTNRRSRLPATASRPAGRPRRRVPDRRQRAAPRLAHSRADARPSERIPAPAFASRSPTTQRRAAPTTAAQAARRSPAVARQSCSPERLSLRRRGPAARVRCRGPEAARPRHGRSAPRDQRRLRPREPLTQRRRRRSPATARPRDHGWWQTPAPTPHRPPPDAATPP